MYRKLFLKLILFLVILYLLDFSAGILLKSTNKVIFTEEMLKELYHETQNIDLVFMGSSHVYRSFDPYFFGETLDLNAFDIGSPFQNPTITYFLLKELIRLKHQPKMLVLETYWPIFCGDNTSYNSASYVFHYMPFSLNKVGLFWHAFEFPSSLRLLSQGFHYRRFVQSIFYPNMGADWNCEYRGKGFMPCEKVATPTDLMADDPSTQEQQFNEYRIQYFEKTIRLARQHQIQVFAVMTPIHPQIFSKIQNYTRFHQRISAICRHYQIDFLDFNLINQEKSLVTQDDFMDLNHLNLKGAHKINHYLEPYLREKMQPLFSEN
ncbi:hypothetical protein L0128_00980 [candidate division KSB1 bacterium]|nr:hypothetical protein [candidate division KSB1 bacterium]